jgi:hypothetical protein
LLDLQKYKTKVQKTQKNILKKTLLLYTEIIFNFHKVEKKYASNVFKDQLSK